VRTDCLRKREEQKKAAADYIGKASVAQGAHRRQAALELDAARSSCDRLPQRQARAECRARLLEDATSPLPANT
jgi:hypothetical protein